MRLMIVMLDAADGTLHKPRDIALKDIAEWGDLITKCGLTLGNVSVGPFDVVSEQAARRCPDCFNEEA